MSSSVDVRAYIWPILEVEVDSELLQPKLADMRQMHQKSDGRAE